jgi:hypothetical protein
MPTKAAKLKLGDQVRQMNSARIYRVESKQPEFVVLKCPKTGRVVRVNSNSFLAKQEF